MCLLFVEWMNRSEADHWHKEIKKKMFPHPLFPLLPVGSRDFHDQDGRALGPPIAKLRNAPCSPEHPHWIVGRARNSHVLSVKCKDSIVIAPNCYSNKVVLEEVIKKTWPLDQQADPRQSGVLHSPHLSLQCTDASRSHASSCFKVVAATVREWGAVELVGLNNWTQLRLLHKLLRFWWVNANIHSSHGHLRQASDVALPFIKPIWSSLPRSPVSPCPPCSGSVSDLTQGASKAASQQMDMVTSVPTKGKTQKGNVSPRTTWGQAEQVTCPPAAPLIHPVAWGHVYILHKPSPPYLSHSWAWEKEMMTNAAPLYH